MQENNGCHRGLLSYNRIFDSFEIKYAVDKYKFKLSEIWFLLLTMLNENNRSIKTYSIKTRVNKVDRYTGF